MAIGEMPASLPPAPAENYDPDTPPIYIQLALKSLGLAESTWKAWKANGLQTELKRLLTPKPASTPPKSPQGAKEVPKRETITTLTNRYRESLSMFLISRLWRKLKVELEQHFREHGAPHITKVAVLGLGSLSDVEKNKLDDVEKNKLDDVEKNKLDDVEKNKLDDVGVMYQFVVMKEISKLVDQARMNTSKTNPLRIYASDPTFNDLDILFLKSHDVVVVPGRDAWFLVDPSALIFGANIYGLHFWSLAVRNPAMMVSHKAGFEDDRFITGSTKAVEDSHRIYDMQLSRGQRDGPADQLFAKYFEETQIYAPGKRE